MVSDNRLRELERRFRATGSVEDEANYLQQRVRLALVAPEALEAASYLGHPGAVRALGRANETHSRTGRLDDVARMLDESQQRDWARRWGAHALTSLEGVVLPRAGLRRIAERLAEGRIDPNFPSETVGDVLFLIESLPDPQSGELLGAAIALLVAWLLDSPVGEPFAGSWRERAAGLRPVRFSSWLASFGSGTVVRLDTASGRDAYRARLGVERSMDLSTYRGRHDRVLKATQFVRGLDAPATPSQLVALETRCGAPLPAGYRRFLLEVAASGAGPSRILSPEEVLTRVPSSSDPARPFPWDGADRSPAPLESFPDGTIPVAQSGHSGDIWTLLVTTGRERGHVWGGVRGHEALRPITRADVAEQVFSRRSLPLGETPETGRLTFDQWYGEWLAFYCAAVEVIESRSS
jgi:hypothetical protein